MLIYLDIKIPHLQIAHQGGNLEVGNIKIHHESSPFKTKKMELDQNTPIGFWSKSSKLKRCHTITSQKLTEFNGAHICSGAAWLIFKTFAARLRNNSGKKCQISTWLWECWQWDKLLIVEPVINESFAARDWRQNQDCQKIEKTSQMEVALPR